MPKYRKANRFLERLIIKNHNKFLLDNETELPIYAAYVSEKFNLSSRDLLKQYRRHIHRMIIARNDLLKSSLLVKEIALKHSIKFNTFDLFLRLN